MSPTHPHPKRNTIPKRRCLLYKNMPNIVSKTMYKYQYGFIMIHDNKKKGGGVRRGSEGIDTKYTL